MWAITHVKVKYKETPWVVTMCQWWQCFLTWAPLTMFTMWALYLCSLQLQTHVKGKLPLAVLGQKLILTLGNQKMLLMVSILYCYILKVQAFVCLILSMICLIIETHDGLINAWFSILYVQFKNDFPRNLAAVTVDWIQSWRSLVEGWPLFPLWILCQKGSLVASYF